MRPNAVAIPFFVRQEKRAATAAQSPLFHQTQTGTGTTGNLAEPARTYLAALGWTTPDGNPAEAAAIWYHSLAIGCSPRYLAENADGIKQDWPRIPVPNSPNALAASADLGGMLAALLDSETKVDHVTDGEILKELRTIARLEKTDGKPLDPTNDLEIHAGWGHPGKDSVTMPGKGKFVQRERTKEELASLVGGPSGLTESDALALLGPTTFDIYLNNLCAWKNIPEKVWEFYIGGYQVIKKWLSYREHTFLKRPLTIAEADEVTNMARRLTQLCLMQPALDANYQRVKAATYPWPKASDAPTIPPAP